VILAHVSNPLPPPTGDEQPLRTGIRVPPPLYYVAGFLIGVGLELGVPIDGPPLAITLIVVVACVVGWFLLDGLATLSFGRAGTSVLPFGDRATALVTAGPYRFSRNPMYLGMALLYVALAFAFDVIWALAVLPFVIAAVDQLVIALEEAYLVRKFGQPYCDYMQRVRRWF